MPTTNPSSNRPVFVGCYAIHFAAFQIPSLPPGTAKSEPFDEGVLFVRSSVQKRVSGSPANELWNVFPAAREFSKDESAWFVHMMLCVEMPTI